MFINTLLVRVKISKEDRVIPWLKEMQQQLLRLRQYEYSPLVKVQGWSEAGRGLFKSIVVFENYPVDEGLGDGRALSRYPESRASKTPVTLWLTWSSRAGS